MKAFLVLQGLVSVVFAQYSVTFTPDNTPDTWQEGQTGTNRCGTDSNQTSMCQNAYINSATDFCLYAPPDAGPNSSIGETERIEVAYCTQRGRGTRLIPDGTLQGVHFVKTPDYVQVTGVGDLTKINIPQGDAGGELDPHGADGNGNPIGGIVFSNAFTGQAVQIHEWTNFMSSTQFCFRACKDGPNAAALCQHIYDEMGCEWNMPANYDPGVFEDCAGDTGEPMGVYGGSTFHQGDAATPGPHPTPSSSQCSSISTVADGVGASTTSSTSASSTTTRATSGRSSATSAAATADSTDVATNAAPDEFNAVHALFGSVSIAFIVGTLGYLLGVASFF